MQKIISLYCRNYETNRQVRDEIVSGAEWVLAGEGIATRKLDGTCAMFRGGKLYKRYDLKAKKGRHQPPPDWEAAQPEPDPQTSSWPGWVPVGDKPEDQYFIEAWGHLSSSEIEDGTYELVGPKVQGNPERYDHHTLVPHGQIVLNDVPRDFEGLKSYLASNDIEGIVWHHPDGRMVKIKARDFGIKRQSNTKEQP